MPNSDQTYTCPMHPEVQKNSEGMCPECGMSLVATKRTSSGKHGAGHDKHEGHSTNVFKRRFWVSLVLSVPVVLYSDIAQELLGYSPPVFFGSSFIPLILGTIIFFYGGLIFLTSAYRELRARVPGMMTLIALAILTAYGYSIYVIISGGTKTLFWELATLITVMLLGHWMEMRAVSGARGALKELSKLLPDKAEVERNGETKVVALTEVSVGDVVVVKPGGKVPTDGEIVEGSSEIDESLVTGESRPVGKQEGEKVIAGTINGDGSLRVRVTEIGEKTFLAGVMRLVEEAQSSKSKLQFLSDRAAYYLTIIAVVSGGATLATWLTLSETAFAVERAVAVLVIACPHALGLAIPLVASISTNKAARNGFLVKQRMALESAREVDVVLFDKTGTLTRGEFGVRAVLAETADKEKETLSLAASINRHSEHSIAKAIVSYAHEQKVEKKKVENFERVPGKGVKAKIDDSIVYAGSESLFDELAVSVNKDHAQKVKKYAGQGNTVIHVVKDSQLIGSMALADIIREESRQAVRDLHNLGIETAMITGDSEDVAKWVAEEVGLDQYFARVLPEKKSEKVKALQGQGKKVAMVGDGINDAPALTQADLGVAVGAGTNVAIESAGIILVKNDPRDIVKIIKLSKMTYTKMLQNLFWATGYNVIALPLAAGVLISKGVILQPALAAIFMSASTVIVAANALLLRRRSIS